MRLLTNDSTQTTGCNMTPIIDVVFLLIIFFMLVCQFIVAENFEVDVPDRISSAQRAEDTQAVRTAIVTVMLDEQGQPRYAVGSRIIDVPTTGGEPTAAAAIITAIAAAIDNQLASLPPERRVVTLRNDKSVEFRYTKYILAALGQSSATYVKWAVIKHKR